MPEYILGEGAGEIDRLRGQAVEWPAADRIRWAGLQRSMAVLDAGCGPGEISRILAGVVGPEGSVTAFDLSEARLNAARAVAPAPGSAPIRYLSGDVCNPPVPPASMDFVFSQFVIEYLPDPRKAVSALMKTLKPGGVLCLCDGDNIGGTNWPMSPELESNLARMLQAMRSTGFDPQVGRKLYTYSVDAGLTDVRARIDPVVNAGPASAQELSNWEGRFAGLAPLGEKEFGGPEAYRAFVRDYTHMLQDVRVLKFMDIVTVSGRVPVA